MKTKTKKYQMSIQHQLHYCQIKETDLPTEEALPHLLKKQPHLLKKQHQ